MKHATGAGQVTDSPRAAVEALAHELCIPLEQVESVYRKQAAAIEASARIKNFVPLIVASRVRSELKRQQRG